MLVVNKFTVQRTMMMVVMVMMVFSSMVDYVHGFSDGRMLVSGNPALKRMYCQRAVLSRAPIHMDAECGGPCPLRENPTKYYSVEVNQTTYWLDGINVRVSAKANSPYDTTGFAVYAVDDTGMVMGSWDETDDVVTGTCDDVIRNRVEDQFAIHAHAKYGRKEFTVTWRPDGYNHRAIKFRIWVVHNHSHVFYLESHELTSEKNGQDTLDINNIFQTLMGNAEASLHQFEQTFGDRQRLGYDIESQNPFENFQGEPRGEDLLPGVVINRNNMVDTGIAGLVGKGLKGKSQRDWLVGSLILSAIMDNRAIESGVFSFDRLKQNAKVRMTSESNISEKSINTDNKVNDSEEDTIQVSEKLDEPTLIEDGNETSAEVKPDQSTEEPSNSSTSSTDSKDTTQGTAQVSQNTFDDALDTTVAIRNSDETNPTHSSETIDNFLVGRETKAVTENFQADGPREISEPLSPNEAMQSILSKDSDPWSSNQDENMVTNGTADLIMESRVKRQAHRRIPIDRPGPGDDDGGPPSRSAGPPPSWAMGPQMAFPGDPSSMGPPGQQNPFGNSAMMQGVMGGNGDNSGGNPSMNPMMLRMMMMRQQQGGQGMGGQNNGAMGPGGSRSMMGGPSNMMGGPPGSMGGPPGMMGGPPGMMGGPPGMMGGQPGMMGGNQGMMGGNQGMMGGNQGIMGGNQGMMGGNQGIMGGNQGMMGGNSGMMGMPNGMMNGQSSNMMMGGGSGMMGQQFGQQNALGGQNAQPIPADSDRPRSRRFPVPGDPTPRPPTDSSSSFDPAGLFGGPSGPTGPSGPSPFGGGSGQSPFGSGGGPSSMGMPPGMGSPQGQGPNMFGGQQMPQFANQMNSMGGQQGMFSSGFPSMGGNGFGNQMQGFPGQMGMPGSMMAMRSMMNGGQNPMGMSGSSSFSGYPGMMNGAGGNSGFGMGGGSMNSMMNQMNPLMSQMNPSTSSSGMSMMMRMAMARGMGGGNSGSPFSSMSSSRYPQQMGFPGFPGLMSGGMSSFMNSRSSSSSRSSMGFPGQMGYPGFMGGGGSMMGGRMGMSGSMGSMNSMRGPSSMGFSNMRLPRSLGSRGTRSRPG